MREVKIHQSDMARLIQKSEDQSYPYFFLFRFSPEKNAFLARRVKKGNPDLTLFLDSDHPLAEGYELLRKAKQKMGEISWEI